MNAMWLGLVIVSIALGYEYGDTWGWFVFGCGAIVFGAINAMIDYLDDRLDVHRPTQGNEGEE